MKKKIKQFFFSFVFYLKKATTKKALYVHHFSFYFSHAKISFKIKKKLEIQFSHKN
jgi:hypothetical protein